MLTKDQIRARERKLTASRVGCLMTGDNDKILNLWRALIGDPTYSEPDLSDVWPVQLGSHTEPLNLAWFERKHGALSRHGEVVTHPTIDWAAATLDAWSVAHECPVEAKHVGGFEPLRIIVDRYQPQVHWQMLCTGARRCALSVIMGAREPSVEFIEFEEHYAAELMSRATAFMECVSALLCPVDMPPVAAPIIPAKEYCMDGRNEWADAAVTWLETRSKAKRFEAATKTIKGLFPPDGVRAAGHGVVATRSRAGAVSIKEEKA